MYRFQLGIPIGTHFFQLGHFQLAAVFVVSALWNKNIGKLIDPKKTPLNKWLFAAPCFCHGGGKWHFFAFEIQTLLVTEHACFPRDPITLSKDDWGVQSPPKRKVFRFHYHPFSGSVRWLDPYGFFPWYSMVKICRCLTKHPEWWIHLTSLEGLLQFPGLVLSIPMTDSHGMNGICLPIHDLTLTFLWDLNVGKYTVRPMDPSGSKLKLFGDLGRNSAWWKPHPQWSNQDFKWFGIIQIVFGFDFRKKNNPFLVDHVASTKNHHYQIPDTPISK